MEVLWERHIGSVMFYLLDMAHERRQACPSVVVKEKQWSISEKDHLGYGRTLIAYAGSGPPCHSTSTYDGPGGVFTIAILKNHGQPFYNDTIIHCISPAASDVQPRTTHPLPTPPSKEKLWKLGSGAVSSTSPRECMSNVLHGLSKRKDNNNRRNQKNNNVM